MFLILWRVQFFGPDFSSTAIARDSRLHVRLARCCPQLPSTRSLLLGPRGHHCVQLFEIATEGEAVLMISFAYRMQMMIGPVVATHQNDLHRGRDGQRYSVSGQPD